MARAAQVLGELAGIDRMKFGLVPGGCQPAKFGVHSLIAMNSLAPLKYELEDVWRERLVETIGRYRLAKLEATEAAVESHDEDMPHADGHFAFRKALQVETAALTEYQRVLEIFNHVVRTGRLPDSDA